MVVTFEGAGRGSERQRAAGRRTEVEHRGLTTGRGGARPPADLYLAHRRTPACCGGFSTSSSATNTFARKDRFAHADDYLVRSPPAPGRGPGDPLGRRRGGRRLQGCARAG